MNSIDLAPRVLVAVAVGLALLGASAALAAQSVIARLVGVVVASLGGACALAFVGAPPAAQAVAAASGLAYLLVGAAILLRIQESYPSLEGAALDTADAAEEPPDTVHGG